MGDDFFKMEEFGGRSRKSLRRFAERIAKKKVGKAFGYGEQDDYFQTNFVETGVCAYLRYPRSNKRGLPTRVFGLCSHSPYGRIGMKTASNDPVKDPVKIYYMGVCQKSLPIDPSFKCPYQAKDLAQLKLERIRKIEGVGFLDETIKSGVSAYVKWRNDHLKLKVYMDLAESNTIRDIHVFGTLENVLVVEGGFIEQIVPIPRKKKSNVRSFLLGMEDLFLKEMLDCFIAKGGQDGAFYKKRNFRNRIRIASS